MMVAMSDLNLYKLNYNKAATSDSLQEGCKLSARDLEGPWPVLEPLGGGPGHRQCAHRGLRAWLRRRPKPQGPRFARALAVRAGPSWLP